MSSEPPAAAPPVPPDERVPRTRLLVRPTAWRTRPAAPSTRPRLLALGGIGLAMVAVVAGLFVLPHLLVLYYSTPILDYRTIPTANPALLALGWVVLFGLYYLGYRICPAPGTRAVAILIAVCACLGSLALLFMYPIGSNDIFDQLFRGHIAAVYGANPFTTMPDTFRQDPWLPYVYWHNQVATGYGPVWEWLAGLTSRLAGGDLLVQILAYKLLVTVHFWGGMGLVYAILRRLRPALATRGLLLFAWNPLLLFEFPGNGHNDAIMIFWLLAAIYGLVSRRPVLALGALGVAIFMKFIPVLVLPLFLAAIWRSGRAAPLAARLRPLALGLALIAGLGLLLYLPFGLGAPGANLTTLSSRGDLFHASVYRLALDLLQDDRGLLTNTIQQWLRALAGAVTVGAVLGGTLWLLARRPDAAPRQGLDRLLRSSYEVLFVYLLLACLWFQPWYVTWLLAFAPLVVGIGVAERTTLFGLAAVSEYFIWHYNWPRPFDLRSAETLLVVTIYLLPLLATLAAWLRLGWRRGAFRAASR